MEEMEPTSDLEAREISVRIPYVWRFLFSSFLVSYLRRTHFLFSVILVGLAYG